MHASSNLNHASSFFQHIPSNVNNPMNHKNQKNHSSDKNVISGINCRFPYLSLKLDFAENKSRSIASLPRQVPSNVNNPMNYKNQKKSQFRQEAFSIFQIVFCFLHLFFSSFHRSPQVHKTLIPKTFSFFISIKRSIFPLFTHFEVHFGTNFF